MAKKKKPEIRFKGFTDDWEQRKLRDVAENFEYGLNVAAKEFDGVKKYIRITDIDDESRQFKQDDLTSPDTDLEIADRYKLEKGDILFARTGASVGKSFIYRDSDGLVYYAGFLIRGKIKPNFDIEFIFQNTLTRNYENYIRITSQRSGQPGVNAQEYQEFTLRVPICEEQKKIGAFLYNLDHLITLHQRKCEKLKNMKKAMLEKLFPKNGSNIPEVRFRGFTDDWEQREAKDIFKTIVDKGYPNLTVLSASQEYGMIKRIEMGINIYHNLQNEMGYKRVQPGQFVIHLRSFQGGFAHSEIEGITSPAYTVFSFQEQEKHYDYFWKYIFNSEVFIKRLELITYGIRDGRSISFEDFSTLSFYFPNYEEQRQIGYFFQKLDHLITLHQRQLEKLKNVKKSMLEKMFV